MKASIRIILICTIASASILALYWNTLKLLTMTSSSAHTKRPEYPSGIPDKFSPDGKVQPFSGNTIICPLSPASELYTSLLDLYEQLDQSPIAQSYNLLPPSSWHMTVFDAVVDSRREPGVWPNDLAANASMDECTAHFQGKLKRFDIGAEGVPYQISVTSADPFAIRGGLALSLQPSPQDETALRGLRDRIAATLGVRKSDHEIYRFHLSIAYLLRYLDGAHEAEVRRIFTEHFEKLLPVSIELGRLEFCTFEDMTAYEPVLVLSETEQKELL